MVLQVTKTAQTVISDSSSGGTTAWISEYPTDGSLPLYMLTRAQDDYRLQASGAIPGGSGTLYSQYMKATNFGFAIPASALILGISVAVRRYAVHNTAAWGYTEDWKVRIAKGGTISNTDRSAAGWWPLINGSVATTYGSSEDLWGEAWTPADVNGAGFGFALAVANHIPGNPYYQAADIDCISMTVFYDTNSGQPMILRATTVPGCRQWQPGRFSG